MDTTNAVASRTAESLAHAAILDELEQRQMGKVTFAIRLASRTSRNGTLSFEYAETDPS